MDKIRFYKALYSISWILLALFFIILIGACMLFDPKAVGILMIYYSPAWLPFWIITLLTVIHSAKLIKLY